MSEKCRVTLDGVEYFAERGERLSSLLLRVGAAVEHPCGGRGACKKCLVSVDGREVLSCEYVICGDISAVTHEAGKILSEVGENVTREAEKTGECELVLDIGTTTLAMAVTDPESGEILRAETSNNPQRAYGADVMSRISYASEHGAEELTSVLRFEVNSMLERLGVAHARRMTAAGNTTMLHLFLGTDPTPMGEYPYTPVFLDEKILSGAECGLACVHEIVLLPGFSAFVGADLSAGLHYVGLPEEGRYRLLVDLGTNAEILLFSKEKILCTSAAAGPCFEGACISSGMSATQGAIYACSSEGECETIDDAEPCGICGTGLVDAVAFLLKTGVVDESGYMEVPAFFLSERVSITREDVRQFQLAKAAVHAGILALMARAKIDMEDVEALYIAGGFAEGLRAESAICTGLLPRELEGRIYSVGNSCLLGACRCAAEKCDLEKYTKMAEYVDLSSDETFEKEFVERMGFKRQGGIKNKE